MPNCSNNLDGVLDLETPPLSELCQVIDNGLKENFEKTEVKIVKCPDLKTSPFNMTNIHFGAGLRIAEVGGPGNLFPNIEKGKEFDLKEICSVCDAPTGGVFGPGAGPWPIVGANCEMVADMNCGVNKAATKIAKIVDDDKGYRMEVIDSSKFSLMANLAVSQKPEEEVEVLHITASVRTGKLNFPECIRQTVAKHYGEKPVSLAGVFILKKGSAKLHVMPDFPGCPWEEEEKISSEWLRYFTMSAPLVCASVFHSHDPGHKLRMEHTHCYSEHGDAGHYHYDTTPEVVEYEGWFAVAEKVYRIDKI